MNAHAMAMTSSNDVAANAHVSESEPQPVYYIILKVFILLFFLKIMCNFFSKKLTNRFSVLFQ